uniref:Bm10464 n=3 Tax=Brugia TaxID=6278 RepID=A0A1I9G3Q5_BRUMA|nr:Bm10464 [Brugia malayi]
MAAKRSETKKYDQNKKQSDKDTNKIQEPMEMASPLTEPEGRGAFRKLFMKLGEKVGTIKTSELNPDYLNQVKDADTYKAKILPSVLLIKEMLCKLAESIMHVLQQNPKLVPEAESKMEFECPLNQDPTELLSVSLEAMRENFSAHIPALEACIRACIKLAELRRSYCKRGRRAIHFIRTFINVDYVLLNNQRQELIKRRQEMDFAKHEYANNPTEQKKESCNKAIAKFKEQSDEVFEALGTIQSKKEKHRIELIKILDEMRKYHNSAAEECFLVCKSKW